MTFRNRLRHRVSFALVPVFLAAIGVAPAAAGPNANAKIMIHLTRTDKAQVCLNTNMRPSCEYMMTSGAWNAGGQPFYHCPLLVTDGNAAVGLAGVSCGIDYSMADVFLGFQTCAAGLNSYDGPNGPWPSDGSGIVLDWDPADTGCQQYEPGGAGTGVVAIAGAFYIAPYLDNTAPPSTIAITPHPQTGLATVQSCAGDIDIVETAALPNSPYRLGHVGISNDNSRTGYNPCGRVVPVVGSTWSTIKALER